MGGIGNQIFASRYVPYIPDKELLIRQVELLLRTAEEDAPEAEGPRAERTPCEQEVKRC